jgi:PadR family transcriptional regulator PadR
VILLECEVISINTQFKKGVLELLVLLIVQQEDKYGYELVEEVSKVVNVNEGTIYPILKRLTNEHYFETYLKESTEGPPRKYYHLTVLGKERKDELLKEWTNFNESVSKFIKESERYE